MIKRKANTKLFILFGLLFVILGFTLQIKDTVVPQIKNLTKSNRLTIVRTSPNPVVDETFEDRNSLQPISTADQKSLYTSKMIPLTFSFLTEMQIGKLLEIDRGGETGKHYSIFTTNKSGDTNLATLMCDYISDDWSAGTDAGYIFRGYRYSQGSYYALVSDYIHPELNKPFEDVKLEPELVTPLSNKFGLQVILIKGQNEVDGPPLRGSPGVGNIGALINFPQGSEFAGMSCNMNVNKPADIENFTYILENLRWEE